MLDPSLIPLAQVSEELQRNCSAILANVIKAALAVALPGIALIVWLRLKR